MNVLNFIIQNPERIKKKSEKESQELYDLGNQKQRIQSAINELVIKIKEAGEKNSTGFDINKMKRRKEMHKEKLKEIEEKIAKLS